MNTRFCKCLVSFAIIFCLIIFTSTVTAGKPDKPGKPPKPSDDPCSTMTTFSPDFVFWRDTGLRESPGITIYVAQSSNGCEQGLVDVPIGELERIRNLKFSSIEDDEGAFSFGRVVWTNEISGDAEYVWMQDFSINGTDVMADAPVPILRNKLFGEPIIEEDIRHLDLSPDTQKLVYEHQLRDETEGLSFKSLRVLEIENCLNTVADPCGFDTEYGHEIDRSLDDISKGFGGFTDPSWKPSGDRIYVVRWYEEYKDLQFYDLTWPNSSGPPLVSDDVLFSTSTWIRNPVSGMLGGNEFLAIEAEFSVKTGGCEGIFLIDLANCTLENCWPKPEFAGAMPSWTKDEKIIHLYDGWRPHGSCRYPSVGLWGGTDNSLEKKLEGNDPNAASAN